MVGAGSLPIVGRRRATVLGGESLDRLDDALAVPALVNQRKPAVHRLRPLLRLQGFSKGIE
jgi:hypothetical protein